MITVVCFCGREYVSERIVVCLEKDCAAYGQATGPDATVADDVDALDWIHAVEALQND